MKPFFSILIPSRNHALLLGFALNSILEQSYGDYEVVISDNNSTDDTAQVVAGLSDQRIRYYKSTSDLSLIDNWNRTYLQSQGQFIIMIGDDDFLLPCALERYAEAIRRFQDAQMLFSRSSVYSYPDLPEVKYRNTVLHARQASGKVESVESKILLRSIFDFHYPFATQTICYSKKLLDEISWNGVPFHPPFPDHFSAGACLLKVPSAICIDSHLIIMGRKATSAGFGIIYSQDRAKRWAEEQMQSAAKPEINREPPLIDGNYFMNGYYNTLQLLKQVYAELARDYTPNLRAYYDISKYHLHSAKRLGASMGYQAEQQLNVRLASLPMTDRLYINFRDILRNLRDMMPLRIHNFAERWLPRNGVVTKLTRMPASITNIQECAQYCVENEVL